MNEDAAREIFPVTMGESEVFTDFRALPPVEESEEADPKGESAPEPASSPDSSNPDEPPTPETTVPQPAARVTTPPRGRATGSQAS